MCALCTNLVACVINTLHCKVKGISDFVYKHASVYYLTVMKIDIYFLSIRRINQ